MTINWITCKIETVRVLYRGKNPKELSINFGFGGLIMILSFESLLRGKKSDNDATLHIYYPQGNQISNRRYYFKTWTNTAHSHDRLMDTLVMQPTGNSFRIISVNDFILS
jgi:hypothetical protein